MLSEDELLVRRCQDNDEAAFDALFHRHLNRVYALVCHYVGNPEEARPDAGGVRASMPHPLLPRAERVHHLALPHRGERLPGEQRKAARRRSHAAFVPLDDVDRALSTEEEGPMDSVVRQETRERVQQAVGDLPEAHRLVVSLRYFQGLSCKEIAEILDCPVGTVNSRLHYAMTKLRAALQEQLAEC